MMTALIYKKNKHWTFNASIGDKFVMLTAFAF